MNLQTAKDIIACLPTGHTPFFYGKDDYALYLLSEQIRVNGGTARVHEVKKSPLALLLQKPALKKIIAQSDKLTPDFINKHLHNSTPLNLSLTLTTWGCDCTSYHCYAQTSRPGYNLVLQVNWDSPAAIKIVKKFKQLFDYDNFNGYDHPVKKDIPTIAWVRIDCDFESGEALIEEIQSDWIRELRESLSDLKQQQQTKDKSSKKLKRLTKRERYWYNLEKHLSKIWSEAALTAATRFIREDLGITKIFYHTFETGCLLKGLSSDYSRPPQSLYTNLPKKFGMHLTCDAPTFLSKSQRLMHAKSKLNQFAFYTFPLFSHERVTGMYLFSVKLHTCYPFIAQLYWRPIHLNVIVTPQEVVG